MVFQLSQQQVSPRPPDSSQYSSQYQQCFILDNLPSSSYFYVLLSFYQSFCVYQEH